MKRKKKLLPPKSNKMKRITVKNNSSSNGNEKRIALLRTYLLRDQYPNAISFKLSQSQNSKSLQRFSSLVS
jgi:hypothetical protein